MSGGDLNALIVDCQLRMMAGDHTAITEVHKRLSPGLVTHFLRRLGATELAGRDTAEELAHRTWIEFWKALQGGTYDPARARPSTFLYAIAGNIWLRYRREQGRKKPISLGDAAEFILDPAGDALDDPTSLAETLDLIRGVVDGDDSSSPFSANERQMLRWIAQGHTERDIAGYLALSASTAHERKRSLLSRFSAFLVGRGCISQKVRATRPPAGEEGGSSS